MNFERLPLYAQEHRASHSRPEADTEFYRASAELIRGLLDNNCSPTHESAIKPLLAQAVRRARMPRRGKPDCDYQSEALVCCSDPQMLVEVEHAWEVAHLVNRMMRDLKEHVADRPFSEEAKEYARLLKVRDGFDPEDPDGRNG